MADLKFSVVTVCFNCEAEIEKTVRSLLNQSFPPYEYIVMDGLSADKTLDIVRSHQDEFDSKGIRLTVVSEKDSGIYNAMNKGIAKASGDFISFLNAGDWYQENTLEVVNKAYQKEQFDLCYGAINYHKLDGTVSVKKSKKDKFLVTSRHWNHPSTFLRNEIYKANPFDETFKIYSDFELFLRVRKNTKIFVLDEVLSNFVADGISTKTDKEIVKKRAKEKYRAYRKNGYGRIYWFEAYLWESFKAFYFRKHKAGK